MAFFVRRGLKHKLLPVFHTNLLECVSLEILLDSGMSIIFHSVYLSGGASNNDIKSHLSSDLKNLSPNLSKPAIILGDLNAKHRLWNCIRANTVGNIVANLIWNGQYLIHFASDSTYIPWWKSLKASFYKPKSNQFHPND